MGYLALYRQWRPRAFSEIIGQEHVTRTLTNALAGGQLSHAYLFCGPRGTGKTSAAKILARAANCLQPDGGEPCNHCANCQRSLTGIPLDLIEIDAASNRGIDEIRELRERVGLSPAEGRYRVYIIDEVHMLTQEAFNALLKTLEEPPRHALFILATTEPHRLPLTVLSRCQRFDFHRLRVSHIQPHLERVAGDSGGDVTSEALNLIARSAGGGMRDALSLLDQCLSGGGRVEAAEVAALVGLVEEEWLAEMAEALASLSPARILELLAEALEAGRDERQLTRSLIEHLRNLLVAAVLSDPGEILELPRENIQDLKRQAVQFQPQYLVELIRDLTKCEAEMRWAEHPRVLIELALVRASSSVVNNEMEELRQRLDRLEEKMSAPGSGESTKEPVRVPAPLPSSGKPVPLEKPLEKPPAESCSVSSDYWERLLAFLKKSRVTTYALLKESRPVSLAGSLLTVGFPAGFAFHKEKIEQAEHSRAVEDAWKNLFNNKIKLVFVLEEKGDKAISFPDPPLPRLPEAARLPGGDEDLVLKAKEIFGGEITEIKE